MWAVVRLKISLTDPIQRSTVATDCSIFNRLVLIHLEEKKTTIWGNIC